MSLKMTCFSSHCCAELRSDHCVVVCIRKLEIPGLHNLGFERVYFLLGVGFELLIVHFLGS